MYIIFVLMIDTGFNHCQIILLLPFFLDFHRPCKAKSLLLVSNHQPVAYVIVQLSENDNS